MASCRASITARESKARPAIARAAARRRCDCAIDGREKAAGALAGERAREFEIEARRGINRHGLGGSAAARRHQRRALAQLRAVEIGDQRAECRHFRPREAAKGIERGDTEIIEQRRSAEAGSNPSRA